MRDLGEVGAVEERMKGRGIKGGDQKIKKVVERNGLRG